MRPGLCVVGVVAAVVTGGFAARASIAAAAVAPASGARAYVPRDCGDIPAAPWLVRDRITGHTISGRYYTVSASNLSCATARTLAAKLTHKRSSGTGFNQQILPGYTCLISVPSGFTLARGGCSLGKKVVLMDPNIKNFNWHSCVAIPSRHEHMRCTVQRG